MTYRPYESKEKTFPDSVYLSRRKLKSIPVDVLARTDLRELTLSDNLLRELPDAIGELVGLRELDLYGNELTRITEAIGNLGELRELTLGNNSLATLPAGICNLAKLNNLFLQQNRLTSLPREIGRLSDLRGLILSDNELTALPPEIGQLSRLERLSVDNNNLRDLPRELAPLLRRGLSLSIDRNPLRDPLPDLVARGTDALAAYLDSLEEAVVQYEAKAMLVGEGNVGKTSLAAALRGFPFVAGRPTTHGIEITPMSMKHPSLDVTMTVRIWDFGGQEVYRITHQFFFSKRALYLVVWNARDGQEQNEVEGWLRRVRLRVGTEARVIIVATHSDERRPELDYPHLQRVFSTMLAGHHQVDSRTANGIEELRDVLAAELSRLPQMGQNINSRWIAARDEILGWAATEPQVPYSRLHGVCREHGLPEDQVDAFVALLHDLGHIIHYGDDEGLRDVVVLNPEWLTKAISYVLEDEVTRSANGVLAHSRLREIWKPRAGGPDYPIEYYPYFLRLMEKFDISYRLDGEENLSLVAQLVPYPRPPLPWDVATPLPPGIRALSLVCKLSEPAPGIIAWFTVRHHTASIDKNWRSGVFLRHPVAGYASEALVTLDSENELLIEVRAPSPDLFFNVLRDSVEDLIRRRWPGLSYQLLVPCLTQMLDGSKCEGRFKLEGLLRSRERGRMEFPCLECDVDYDVSALLTGFARQDISFQSELERLHSKIDGVSEGIGRLAADSAHSMRKILKAVSAEVTDCPRLFTLTTVEPKGIGRLRFAEESLRLTLWCEHPTQCHPWPAAGYDVREPKEWLVAVLPYLRLVFNALKLVVPVAASVVGAAMSKEQFDQASRQLNLMKTLVDKLPVPGESSRSGVETHDLLEPVEGQALRSLRVLLFKLDPVKAFGDLRRVQVPAGELIWVCPDHYQEYDPGLPDVPR